MLGDGKITNGMATKQGLASLFLMILLVIVLVLLHLIATRTRTQCFDPSPAVIRSRARYHTGTTAVAVVRKPIATDRQPATSHQRTFLIFTRTRD